jgi:hypothetical protein
MTLRAYLEIDPILGQYGKLWLAERNEFTGARRVFLPAGQLAMKEMQEGESAHDIEPFIRADVGFFQDLYKALHAEFERQGIRPDEIVKKEAKNEGKLEATKAHLDDLRSLLRLDNGAATIKISVES